MDTQQNSQSFSCLGIKRQRKSYDLIQTFEKEKSKTLSEKLNHLYHDEKHFLDQKDRITETIRLDDGTKK